MKSRYAKWDDITTPRGASADGQWRCRRKVCGLVVPERKSWCSDYCRQRCKIECGIDVRVMVFRRDLGICALCGTDTVWLYHAWMRMRGAFEDRREWQHLGRLLSGLRSDISRSWWEADHVQPVAEGGGGCDLSNLRTLCMPCHLEQSRALAKRLAAAKQERRAS